LLVDDEPEWCELITCVLGEAGRQVAVASDVPTLKRLLPKYKVDIALVDLGLPEGGALPACQTIKGHMGRHLPLILCWVSHWEVVADAKAKGWSADDWLIMPFTVEDVVERVERLSSARKLRRRRTTRRC